MEDFEDQGLRGGIWRGRIRRQAPPGRILLLHMGEVIGPAEVKPEAEGLWQISVQLPVDCLTDGAATFALHEDGGGREDALQPGSACLATLPLIAGQALHRDLRSELTLLRAELDLLKREFRRHAALGDHGGDRTSHDEPSERRASATERESPHQDVVSAEARETLMANPDRDASAAHGQPPAPPAEKV